jgi:hypothetical protein
MSESSISNFSILSPRLGQVVVQPVTFNPSELESATIVVYPQRISKESFEVGVEWAASTQTPIFCLKEDVERFEQEGFGSYRFHKLEGYKEVDYEGGSIEFFPAREKSLKGLRGLTTNLARFLGKRTPNAFHFLVHPKGEASILYLASDQVNSHEWELFMKKNPSHIVGSTTTSNVEWHSFSSFVKKRIYTSHDLMRLKTVARTSNTTDNLGKENPLWAVKSGSL